MNMQKKWSRGEVAKLYYNPILDLIFQAATVHRQYYDPREIQVCTLLSIKTGACSEDCGYCSQSSRYDTGLEREKLMDSEIVFQKAKKAKKNGSTRFCMGAAWRQVKNNQDFETILKTVKQVSGLDLEVCCTLGMLTREQAVRLKEAGLHAYNHNLDTSEGFYNKVITTRTYQDRLETINHVLQAGMSLCCGGIIGMGESNEDRVDLLYTLVSLPEPPESVPVNALVSIPGTPLEKQERVSVWEMIRMIATARILMPRAMVRLSAGRKEMSEEEQALCFLAGANSIFAGDKLLTTPNPELDEDANLFHLLGLRGRKPYQSIAQREFSESLSG